ncbi:MAG: enoyl-CoA hydratase/isomerase family protein [Kofleriaceae bacterium]
MTGANDAVKLERTGAVAVVTLNVPEKRNALTRDLLDGLVATCHELADNRDVRCVVLTGAGQGFCSGADFATTAAAQAATGATGAMASHGAIKALYGALLSVERLPQPVIAAINGAAIGGGLGLALLADIRIVAEDAKLAVNFAKLGIHPGLGISEMLARTIGLEAAAELLYTGKTIRGAEAVALGLARRAVPAADVVTTAMALAQEIAACAPLAVRAIKRTLQGIGRRGLDDIRDLEAMAQAMLAQTEDAREGVMASVQRREPQFQGK